MNWSKSASDWIAKASLAFSLALGTFVPASNTPIFAQDEEQDIPENYFYSLNELADFFNQLESGCAVVSQDGLTMTMKKDLFIDREETNGSYEQLSANTDSNYILDLNGHSITTEKHMFLDLYADKADLCLEITDGKGGGKIESISPFDEENPFPLFELESIDQKATLLLSGGTYVGNNGFFLAYQDSEIILNGPTLYNNSRAYETIDHVDTGAILLCEQSRLDFIDGELYCPSSRAITALNDNTIYYGRRPH